MKPVVLCSVNDASGQRCVDLLRLPDGQYQLRECRRDPEDGYGWRPLSAVAGPCFPTAAEAKLAAADVINWLEAGDFC